MKKVRSSLKQGARGAAVADLHEALRLLLAEGAIRVRGAGRNTLAQELERERNDGVYGAVTGRLVGLFQEQHDLRASGTVDRTTAQALNKLLPADRPPPPAPPPPAPPPRNTPYLVKGLVRMEDGSPAADVDVAAFDRDLRSEQLLGQTRTDADGRYEIRYTADAFVRRERAGPDLVVKAFAGTSRDAKSLLAASPTLFNAPPQAEVNLVIRASEWRPASLMERIDRAVRPLLGKVAIEALEQNDKHDDIAFLAGETGFAREALARFVLAHRLAREAIQPEFWFALLGGAWFRYAEDRSLDVQLTGLRSALALVDAAAARKTLVRSFDRNEIPAGLRDNIDKWIAAFMRFAARLAIGDTSQPSVLGWAIERAGIEDADEQRAIAALVAENKGFTRQVVEGLRKHAAFSKQEVADLDVSFQLADLTRGDASVVQAIREDFDVREPAQVRALAHKSTRDWSDLIARKAGEIDLPLLGGDDDRAPAPLPAAELYAGQLERRFREAFPTAAFAGGLARALRNGGTHGFEHAAPLQRFLDDHEDFELLTTHIDEFLDKQARPAHRAAARTEGFRRELKATQRVFKLAPRFEATDALLADGVHSAQAIYRMGESKFVQRYAGREGFDRDTARLVWNRAADTHAAVLTVVADLKAHEAESLPHVLLNGNAALSQFPNWENLFKSGDLCECEHCRSVLSPAAYFADLLMFLRDRHAINPASSAKDILFDRRPDLGFIELNCDNALTPLPDVDVVCEVLEAVDRQGRRRRAAGRLHRDAGRMRRPRRLRCSRPLPRMRSSSATTSSFRKWIRATPIAGSCMATTSPSS